MNTGGSIVPRAGADNITSCPRSECSRLVSSANDRGRGGLERAGLYPRGPSQSSTTGGWRLYWTEGGRFVKFTLTNTLTQEVVLETLNL